METVPTAELQVGWSGITDRCWTHFNDIFFFHFTLYEHPTSSGIPTSYYKRQIINYIKRNLTVVFRENLQGRGVSPFSDGHDVVWAWL